ncbi:heterokaryon incompatibility protein-domain-containing protein [Cercophora newfieldiana]|uniref:Heterokaryon incompatibility protein-domain-containing protein n=1 Tax=Cercophora newfieldiana TaxID=92897 RepID=A0AA39Y976_9PEZI|nr:heterokaryon incompatibility protein-domain-containing protein [Cercophora newfieldiana]
MSVISSNPYRCSVLVMGITGAGKSRLVNMLAGDGVAKEGTSYRSCTQRCLVVPVKFDGTEFFLIDTPSFDDPARDSLEILSDIADVLVSQHKLGIRLRGVVYVHPVTDGMTQEVANTLNIIMKILGASERACVLPVFSQWSRVGHVDGNVRFAALAGRLHKQGICCGLTTDSRFLGDRASAAKIARQIPSLSLAGSPESLLNEIVHGGLDVRQTTTAKYISSLSIASFMFSPGEYRDPPQRRSSASVWGLVPSARAGDPLLPSRFATTQDEEKQATAEMFLNHFLRQILMDYYDPVEHWTSNARRSYGHKPFDDQDRSISSFTIKDKGGKVKLCLQQQGLGGLTYLDDDAVFHIQVVCSPGEITSTFDLEPEQAKALHYSRTATMILAYVANIDIEPSLALFPILWQQHLKGALTLREKIQGSFNEKAKVLYVSDFNTTRKHEVSSESNSLRYQALKGSEIRLLDLKPGKFDDPLVGDIVHANIDSPGAYQAISYVWGTPLIGQRFHLITPDGSLEITPSLDAALRVIRNKKWKLRLWADAICINQQDLLEKGLQIRKMSEIFSRAVRVVAWLGQEEKGDGAALRYMERLCSRPSSAQANPARLSQSMRSLLGRDKELRNDPIELDGVNQILKRPWFQRAWIAQELVLSSTATMLCGKRLEVEWDRFFQALTLLGREESITRSEKLKETLRLAGSAYALGTTRKRIRNNTRYSLLELFELFSHTKATIEVDKLFALLGLAHDGGNQTFSPDYDSSLEEVVRAYARGFIDQGQVLDLLYRSGQGRSYFSSWIPNLTSHIFPRSISEWNTHDGSFAAGGSGSPVFWAEGNHPSRLEITGHMVTTIQETAAVSMTGDLVPNFFHVMKLFRKFLDKTYPAARAPRRNNMLVQIPIAKARSPRLHIRNMRAIDEDADVPGTTPPRTILWPPDFQNLVVNAAIRGEIMGPDALSTDQKAAADLHWQTAKTFAAHFGHSQGDMAFCVTKTRFVGVVPFGTAVGDVVCVVPGAKVPFLLRKNEREGNKGVETWRLIGECYLDGIMYGDGLKGGGKMKFLLE